MICNSYASTCIQRKANNLPAPSALSGRATQATWTSAGTRTSPAAPAAPGLERVRLGNSMNRNRSIRNSMGCHDGEKFQKEKNCALTTTAMNRNKRLDILIALYEMEAVSPQIAGRFRECTKELQKIENFLIENTTIAITDNEMKMNEEHHENHDGIVMPILLSKSRMKKERKTVQMNKKKNGKDAALPSTALTAITSSVTTKGRSPFEEDDENIYSSMSSDLADQFKNIALELEETEIFLKHMNSDNQDWAQQRRQGDELWQQQHHHQQLHQEQNRQHHNSSDDVILIVDEYDNKCNSCLDRGSRSTNTRFVISDPSSNQHHQKQMKQKQGLEQENIVELKRYDEGNDDHTNHVILLWDKDSKKLGLAWEESLESIRIGMQ